MKYSAGTTILAVTPVCCVLKNRYRGKRCDSCFRQASESRALSRCSACKVVYFCGRECQERLWPLHRIECAAIKVLAKSSASPLEWLPTETVRLLFYMLEIYNDKSLVKSDEDEVDPGWKTSLSDLMSHANDVRIDLARSEQFAHVVLTLKRMADALSGEGITFTLPDTSSVLTLFGIICINGITIVDEEMTSVLGTGIYLSPSALDHSCKPNCVAVFEGTRLILRTISAVDSDSEKLTINYIDLLQTRDERMTQLRTQYYFTCDCPLCAESSHADAGMKAGRCPHCDGAVVSTDENESDYVCSECKSTDLGEGYALTLRSAMNDVQFTIEQLKSRKQGIEENMSASTDEVMELAKSCLKRVKQTLHDSNIYITQLADMAAEACVALAHWSNALDFAQLALIGYRQHLPKNYPLLGLLLAKIGKIILLLGEHNGGEALRSLQEAHSILSTAYPPESQIVTEVGNLASQCEEELRCDLDNERRVAISGHS